MLLVCPCIDGTVKEIGRIRVILCAASGTVVIHLFATVCTVQKSSQRIGFTHRINSSWRLTQLLSQFPCFFINNGFMGILKNQPFLFGVHYGSFVLIGLFMGTEVNRMPHIFRLRKNLCDNIAAPVIGIRKFFFAFPDTLILLAEINSRGFNLIVKEYTGNLIRTVALNGQAEDPADNCRRFFVNQPVVFVIRVFLVSVDRTVCGRLAGFTFHTNCSALLAAQVTKIPLVHNIQKRGKFVAVLIVAVHTVGNGNKVNIVLPEKYLGVKSGLEIITSRPAHIFHNDMSHLSGFDVGNQLFPRRAFKIPTTPTVIRIMGTVFVAHLCGIAFEVFFLIDNGVAIPGRFIVTGQSFI